MLVDQDTDPTKSLYFLGARIIEQFRTSSFGVTDPSLLYRQLNDDLSIWNTKISFDYYMLALDWLYLIGAVEISERGDIVKCF